MPFVDIKSGEVELVSARTEGEKIIFDHVQYTDDIISHCADLRKEDDFHNLSNRSRTLEKIATVPGLEIIKHPEWKYDREAILKYLRGEGSKYRTSRRRI